MGDTDFRFRVRLIGFMNTRRRDSAGEVSDGGENGIRAGEQINSLTDFVLKYQYHILTKRGSTLSAKHHMRY
jgi:hypothetical protein